MVKKANREDNEKNSLQNTTNCNRNAGTIVQRRSPAEVHYSGKVAGDTDTATSLREYVGTPANQYQKKRVEMGIE